MKIISLIVLFRIIKSTWQYSFLNNRVGTTSIPPTTTSPVGTIEFSSDQLNLSFPPPFDYNELIIPNNSNPSFWSVFDYTSFSSYLRRRKRQTTQIPKHPKQDLVNMMNKSGSVETKNFELAKTIVSGKVKKKTSPLLTAMDTLNTCTGKPRTWGLCYGSFPAIRTTTDSCTKETEICNSEKLTASKFINTFIPSSMPLFSHEQSFLRRKRQILSVPPKRDLLFMIDESGSGGRRMMKNATILVSGIVKLLCGSQTMHPNKTRISVMSFDSVNHLHVPLLHPTFRALNNNADVLHGYMLGNMKYNSTTAGSTCLNSALLYARDVALSASNGGRRGEDNVLQEIIILTDGCANCKDKNTINSTIRALSNVGIKIYVIGLGLSNSCKNTLNILASRGNCYHFFNFQNWDYDVGELIKSFENVNLLSSCIHQLIGSTNLCLPENQLG